MATLGRSNNASTQNTSRRSYISTDAYNGFFFIYSQSTLSAVPGASGNAPAGRILRETGRKLYPAVNPGVSNYMVSVYDSVSLLTGFIDPNARVFAPYNADKPNFLSNDDNTAANRYGGMYGPSLLTGGNIVQIGLDANDAVTPSYMGVIDNLSTPTKYAQLYQWHEDSNMYADIHDHTTGDRAYLSSDGHAIATRGIGYRTQAYDTQSNTTSNAVYSLANSPAGIIHLAGSGISIPAYSTVAFTLYNSTIGANDYLSVQWLNAHTLAHPGYFNFSATCTAPSTAVVSIINNTVASQTPGGDIQYILFKTSDNAFLEPC